MDVSVIIVNYNTFELTCEAVRSVYEKTQGCSVEIIVVDNASTERPPAEFLAAFPRIVLVENKVNAGFAKGNNAGLARATGEYVLLLNSDAMLQNNAIHICLERLRREPAIAAIGCRLSYPDGKVQYSCQRFPSLRYKLFELLRLQKLVPSTTAGKILLGYFFDHNRFVYADWIWGTFFLFRRELLKGLPGGMLRDEFFMYGEDMQWCLDFRTMGYRIAFEPRAHVVHRMGGSRGEKAKLMKAHHDIFLRQNYPGWKIPLIQKLDDWLTQTPA